MARDGAAHQAWVLAGLMAAFIAYGSLYPFHVQALPPGVTLAQAWRMALAAPQGGRGDLLANLALYMPLGLALAAAGRGAAWLALPRGILLCAALSAAMETAQLYIPGRVASIWDLALNTAGGGAGALAWVVLRPGRRRLPAPRDLGAALLLAGWLGYRLYPYLPATDRGAWLASLRPLQGPWLADPVRVLRLAGAWLVAARLLAAAAPGRPGLAAAMMLGTLAAAVPIIGRVLTPAEVLAVLLALPAWALLRGWRHVDPVLLVVMLAVVLAEGLAPYRLLPWARPFGWLPFGALLGGENAAGLQAALLKVFLYGGLLWQAVRAGLRFRPAAAAVVALALAIGLVQTRLPGRSADATDAALALAAALALRPGLGARDRRG
ncbi:MAG: VanZ family protein [Acetobacteraceae bacterium]|nr:VanZ family protein [Acetobacteraceae bacterium]